jgi:SAM-dependent methyltransferase
MSGARVMAFHSSVAMFSKIVRLKVAPILGPTLKKALRKLRWDGLSEGAVPIGSIKWGNLRRTEPVGKNFGYDRGTPIDRFYIEDFLSRHAHDVGGHVLEVKDRNYTTRFGAAHVTRSDVLDIDPTNSDATIIIDLNAASYLPPQVFDCIILTQTLQYVFDLSSAIQGLHRSLKPGGIMLITVPGLSPIDPGQTWYWSFTRRSVERLLKDHCPTCSVVIENYGNVLSSAAFLFGLSTDELSPDELNARDPSYQVIISAHVKKPV